jgi:cytochrome P450
MMTVLRVLLERLSSFELAGDPVWKPNNSLRSLSSLPVRVTRR